MDISAGNTGAGSIGTHDSGSAADTGDGIGAGDTVQLKSGGPVMTVEWVDDGEAYCVWFDGNHQNGTAFKTTSLTK